MKISVQSLFEDYEDDTVELRRDADTARILEKTMAKLPNARKKRPLHLVLIAAAAVAILCGAAAITHYATVSQEEKTYTFTTPTQTPAGHLVEKEYVIHNDNSIRFDTQGRTDGYYCGMQLGWLPEAKESILGTLGELLQSSNEESYAALSAEDVQQTTSLLSRGDFWLEQNHESCSVMCLSANWVVGVDLLMAALVFRQEQTHGQTRRLRDQTACRRRGGDGMLGEDAFIRGTELNHQFFFLVMRHQGDIHAALLSFASIFYV